MSTLAETAADVGRSLLRSRLAAALASPHGVDRYLEIVDPLDFQPVEEVRGPVVAAGALWVGTTRLIDNMSITFDRITPDAKQAGTAPAASTTSEGNT